MYVILCRRMSLLLLGIYPEDPSWDQMGDSVFILWSTTNIFSKVVTPFSAHHWGILGKFEPLTLEISDGLPLTVALGFAVLSQSLPVNQDLF